MPRSSPRFRGSDGVNSLMTATSLAAEVLHIPAERVLSNVLHAIPALTAAPVALLDRLPGMGGPRS